MVKTRPTDKAFIDDQKIINDIILAELNTAFKLV